MIKMTVKDFIIYNSPCFSCGEPIFLKLSIKSRKGSHEYLSMVFDKETLEVSLTITYNFSLKLKIFHATNKFTVNNLLKFKEYLDQHNIILTSKCYKCDTYIDTVKLNFDLQHNFILPVYLNNETLKVNFNKDTTYILKSSYEKKKSVLIVENKIEQATYIDTPPQIKKDEIHLPLISLSKIKTRERFLDKIKTYLIFS